MIKATSAQPSTKIPLEESEAYTWRPLTYMNYYRLLISGVFLAMWFINSPFSLLASHNPLLFHVTSVIYFLAALGFFTTIRWRRPDFSIQVHVQIITDIIATTILMYASSGVKSGLGMLIIIAIAGGSMMIRGRHALLFASIGTIAVLFQHQISIFEGIHQIGDTLQAGLLGITFFASAIITHYVAKHLRESEALAKERGVDLANMAQLTELIIQRMQTGILVIDPDSRLRLINESAWHMLGEPSIVNNPTMSSCNAQIWQALQQWREQPESSISPIKLSAEYPNLLPRFARLSQDKNPAVLVFLEDASVMAREAQQLQLASLGRLTASIAHEIRNPLGAISHAGQLLAESPHLDTHDQRLTQIIGDHSKRVNTIIENVMQLGKGHRSQPQLIDLKTYLEIFVKDFLLSHAANDNDILIYVQPMDLQVRFDPTHLQQILTNLCDNGLRHSKNYEGFPKLELLGGIATNNNRPYLDIIDHGQGIDSETAQHIFEPFYTTAETGTGLGLYISRELAECNQAHLTYVPDSNQGTQFRLIFADPRRQMN